MRAPSRRATATAVVFAALLIAFGYVYQGSDHNAAARIDLTRAVAEGAGIAVDRFRYNSGDLVEVEGRTYSTKAPGLSFVAIPAFALAAGLRGPTTFGWDFVLWFVTATTVGAWSAAAGALAFRSLDGSHGTAPAAAAVAGIWLGTILFPFSTLFFSHASAAALVFVAAVFALGATSRGAIALSGLATGVAITLEYPAAIPGALIAALVLRRHGLRGAAEFALGAAPALLALGAYHAAAFGGPLTTPYGALAASHPDGGFGATHAQGLSGIAWRGPEAFARNLWAITFAPQRGLFFANPVLLLAPAGALVLYRRGLRAPAVLSIAALVALLVFTASFGDSIVYWGGGASVGPRHVIPALPLLAWPLAEAASRWPRTFAALFAPSFAAMVSATFVDPRFPYEYANPVRDFALRFYALGEFAQNRSILFADGPPAIDAAWNWGARAGLPLAASAAPLLAVLSILSTTLLPSPARRAFAGLCIALAAAPAAGRWTRPVERGPWHATYTRSLHPAARVERVGCARAVDFDWTRNPPFSGAFRAVFEAKTTGLPAGRYSFRLAVDDRAELWIDDAPAIRSDPGTRTSTFELNSTGGEHILRVEYENTVGTGFVSLYWRRDGGPETVVPAEALLEWGCRGDGP